jgi:hypothetical protein
LGHARSRAAPDDDTNASFRTKSQSFLHGARNCSELPDKLLCVRARVHVSVPETSTCLMFILGMAMLLRFGRKRAKK